MDRLTPEQHSQLYEILMDSYDVSSLKRMLRHRLNKKLDEIVPMREENSVIYDLIELAEQEDWTADLIMAAQKHRPRNDELRTLCEQLGLSTEPAPSPWPGPDPRPAQKRWIIVGVGLIALVAIGFLLWRLRPQPMDPRPVTGCTVNTDQLNVRSGPGTVYPVKGVLKKGEAIRPIGYSPTAYLQNEGAVDRVWLEIASPVPGWLNMQLVTCPDGFDLEDIFPTPAYTPSTPALTPTLTFTPTSIAAATPGVATAIAVAITPMPTLHPRAGELLVITQPFRMEFVRVPAGLFLMGSDRSSDPEAQDSEMPQHSIPLADFYIAKNLVTNEQYKAFLDDTKRDPPDYWMDGLPPKGQQKYPAVGITWHEAMAFTEWLSRATHMELRLPTEAEWEKACRGTDGRVYPWGDTPPPSLKYANFGLQVGWTRPVGAYSPTGDSPYSATDMVGNVWEYTGSLWGQNADAPGFPYPYVPGDGRESLNAPEAVLRTLRGGAYHSPAADVRCARRIGYQPNGTGNRSTGFRVAMTP